MGILDFFRRGSKKAPNKNAASKAVNSLKDPVPPPPPSEPSAPSNTKPTDRLPPSYRSQAAAAGTGPNATWRNSKETRSKHSHVRNYMLPPSYHSATGANKTRRNNANLEAELEEERTKAKARGEQWTRQRLEAAKTKILASKAAKKAENNARVAAVERSRKEAEEQRAAVEAKKAAEKAKKAENNARAAEKAKKGENNARMAAVERSRQEAEAERAIRAELEKAAAELKKAAPAVAVDVPGLVGAAEAAANGNAPAKPAAKPGDRFLCDADFTRKIARQRAAIEEIHASRKKLGQGSYGYTTSAEIYLKPKQGTPFDCIGALKVSVTESEELSNDQLGEFSVYARTRSKPCIAQGLYVKLAGRQMKMVMEHYLVDLENLYKDVVHNAYRRDPFGNKEVLEELTKAVIYQMLVGLKGLHSENIIHRDLKPENVLLGHGGSIVVTDFGLSFNNPFGFEKRQLQYWHASTAFIEPPESVFEQGFDAKFDIWSLGCCLIYYLLKTRPFNTRDAKWRVIITKEGFTSIRNTAVAEVERQYSKGAGAFLMACLRSNPEDRPSTEEAMGHPWFGSMTLQDAQQIVNKHIGQYISDTTARKVSETRRKGNANTNVNTDGGSFIRIEPYGDSKTEWKLPAITGEEMNKKVECYGIAFVRFIYNKFPMPLILHTFELFERVVTQLDRFPENPDKYIYTCTYIASKICEVLRENGLSENAELNIVRWSGMKATDLLLFEKKIVQLLHGDLYMQPNGFAVQFADICIKPSLPKSAYDKPRIIYIMSCFLLYTTSIGDISDTYFTRIAKQAEAFERVYTSGSLTHLTNDEKMALDIIQGYGEKELDGFIRLLLSPNFKNAQKKLLLPSALSDPAAIEYTHHLHKSLESLVNLYKGVH